MTGFLLFLSDSSHTVPPPRSRHCSHAGLLSASWVPSPGPTFFSLMLFAFKTHPSSPEKPILPPLWSYSLSTPPAVTPFSFASVLFQLPLWPMEVPGPVPATEPLLRQHQIRNPLPWAGAEPALPRRQLEIINPLCHSGNSPTILFNQITLFYFLYGMFAI